MAFGQLRCVFSGALVVFRSPCPHGLMPKRKCRRFGAGVVLVTALTVAGCASRAPTYVRAPVYQPATQGYIPARVAGYRHQNRVEIEDDGMEAQTPPPLARRPVVDDPTEPFSPNYGRFRTLKRADAGATPTYVPNDLPEEFRNRLAKQAAGT